jgi:hypothetical protein
MSHLDTVARWPAVTHATVYRVERNGNEGLCTNCIVSPLLSPSTGKGVPWSRKSLLWNLEATK